ncbi:Uncharacterized protein involved in exopolysaccharide biosynthesis [Nitrosovibrio sp. Nv17]|nr:Uncharacterized protein involved in exopolysaccharide biosynthesis [Nitrosovibrio sp. Nv17]
MERRAAPRILPGEHRSSGMPARGESGYYTRRFRVFGTLFLVSAAIGLAYDYSRPAIYRSSATLLTSAMTAIDRESGDADIQHVAIQRQVLLGSDLMEATLSRLKEAGRLPSHFAASDLQVQLHADPVPETNIVELRAEGSDPAFLPVLVNTWIDAYLDTREREVRQVAGDTRRVLEDELQGLAERIDAARKELQSFRTAHDISSTGREENEALAHFKALTDALSRANEEEIKARANVEAIQSAILRGKPVVPNEEKGSVLELEVRLQGLRQKLMDLEGKYTREYIELHPEYKFIPEQIRKLEEEVTGRHREGRDAALEDAEVAYSAARQTTRELRAQLDAHKHRTASFTTEFARHDALSADLESLEKLHRETQERLTLVRTGQKEKYPQVAVISRAHESTAPVRPDYGGDALIVLAGSLLLGLLGVWLLEYLSRKNEGRSPLIPVFEVHHAFAGGDLPDRSRMQPAPLGHGAVPALAVAAEARELSSHHLKTLLKAANPRARQMIGLLLSGLDMDEIVALKPEWIDLETGTLSIAGRTPRILPLSGGLRSLLEQTEGRVAWNPGDPDLRIDLSAALVCAAVDSGLPDPESVTAWTIRHSYIVYLVRQGIRLSDLERIVGHVEPAAMSSYSRYSPQQPGRLLEEVELFHPAMILDIQ